MKAQKQITPALLVNPIEPKVYQVAVNLGKDRWAELNFSERDMATAEYNRIKGQSIYCGVWITEIQLKEIKNETMA
jgi:hypothetical protein